MGEFVDARLRIAIEKLRNVIITYRELYKDVPLCKTMTDFFAHHGVLSHRQLTPEQKTELMDRMKRLFSILEKTSKELLTVYNVDTEGSLAGSQRKIYDARMKAIVLREDHYP